MNILLATYSYYPYNYGGTEVYVSGLAGYLKNEGHNVIIIAGMPADAFREHPVLHEDEHLKTIDYHFNSIRIIGVVMKNVTTTEIYRKHRIESVTSWAAVLNKLPIVKWDIVHMHAITSTIGESLLEAAMQKSPAVKFIASYHVPVSCVKGTLAFGNKIQECNVTPSVDICTPCNISSKQNWPFGISGLLSSLIPYTSNEKLPTSLRIKYLIKQFLIAFRSFDKHVDQWHVFSEQIRHILILNKVDEKKIMLLRHGVNPVFFPNANDDSIQNRKASSQTIFLFAARFNKVKGFFTMLRAWNTLPENKERILWMIGENQSGEDEVSEAINKTAQRNDIKWLGIKSQSEIAKIMKDVHCTMIPSEWVEIGPLIFHEAIAAGCDVIASDIGGCKELAHIYKIKSQMFKSGNATVLAQKILDFKYSGFAEYPDTQQQNYKQVLASYQQVPNEIYSNSDA